LIGNDDEFSLIFVKSPFDDDDWYITRFNSHQVLVHSWEQITRVALPMNPTFYSNFFLLCSTIVSQSIFYSFKGIGLALCKSRVDECPKGWSIHTNVDVKASSIPFSFGSHCVFLLCVEKG
jgi:hypothetical protein